MSDQPTENNRAVHFQETRLQHLLEIAEDYTELIADLKKTQKKIRVCELAKTMGVSHVSVLKTINRLTRDGYVIKDSSHSIELTEKGLEMAAHSKRKHLILTEFLTMLGVPDQILKTDVEGIEHHISVPTLEAIEFHIKQWKQLFMK